MFWTVSGKSSTASLSSSATSSTSVSAAALTILEPTFTAGETKSTTSFKFFGESSGTEERSSSKSSARSPSLANKYFVANNVNAIVPTVSKPAGRRMFATGKCAKASAATAKPTAPTFCVGFSMESILSKTASAAASVSPAAKDSLTFGTKRTVAMVVANAMVVMSPMTALNGVTVFAFASRWARFLAASCADFFCFFARSACFFSLAFFASSGVATFAPAGVVVVAFCAGDVVVALTAAAGLASAGFFVADFCSKFTTTSTGFFATTSLAAGVAFFVVVSAASRFSFGVCVVLLSTGFGASTTFLAATTGAGAAFLDAAACLTSASLAAF
mmetsp:Transcript_6565/g.21891  ORF Transcript_6565/g.21891 Transcript_6565/m.21891 type:complete len:331 (+) Transcript_6565:434-1426(+)